MKKRILLSLLIAAITLPAHAQSYIFGETVGRGVVYHYSELDFAPRDSNLSFYTSTQYGVADWLDVGFDLSAGYGETAFGFVLHGGYEVNQWFKFGLVVDPSFNLNRGFKFDYITNLLLLNGALTPSGNLWWSSNTLNNVSRDGDWSLENWWYLGYDIELKGDHCLTPAIGAYHSWLFDTPADIALSLGYNYKWFNCYIYCYNLLPQGRTPSDYMPSFALAIDLEIPTK